MRALARIRDTNGVHGELQRLRTALDDIDEQPSAETVALAARLLRENADSVKRHDPGPPDDTHRGASEG